MADRNGSGKKVIQAIAMGAAAFVEQVLTEMLQRLLDWAKARHRHRLAERHARIQPQN